MADKNNTIYGKIPADEKGKDRLIIQLKTQLDDMLQDKKEKTAEGRKAIYFCFVLVLIILFDVFAFTTFREWGSSISILILELILLITLARLWGVNDLTNILDKYILSHKSFTKGEGSPTQKSPQGFIKKPKKPKKTR